MWKKIQSQAVSTFLCYQYQLMFLRDAKMEIVFLKANSYPFKTQKKSDSKGSNAYLKKYQLISREIFWYVGK